MKVAFFDTKSYDLPGFKENNPESEITFKFYDTKLNIDTVQLAQALLQR